LLAWATANGIPLVRVEYVVPFIETEFGTNVWLFYDTDASVASCADAGTTANVQEKFLATLADNGYPADWLADTSFDVDSHENVQRNFARGGHLAPAGRRAPGGSPDQPVRTHSITERHGVAGRGRGGRSGWVATTRPGGSASHPRMGGRMAGPEVVTLRRATRIATPFCRPGARS
jgi:hypothetical protein